MIKKSGSAEKPFGDLLIESKEKGSRSDGPRPAGRPVKRHATRHACDVRNTQHNRLKKNR